MVVSSTPYKLSRVRATANAGLFAYRFLAYVPFSAIAMTITAAAKIELYTYLACEAHRPVVNPDRDATLFLGHDNPTYSLTLDRTLIHSVSRVEGSPFPQVPTGRGYAMRIL